MNLYNIIKMTKYMLYVFRNNLCFKKNPEKNYEFTINLIKFPK